MTVFWGCVPKDVEFFWYWQEYHFQGANEYPLIFQLPGPSELRARLAGDPFVQLTGRFQWSLWQPDALLFAEVDFGPFRR